MDEPRSLARILVATDFSARAAQTFHRVSMLPLAQSAQIALIHVLPSQMYSWKPHRIEPPASMHLQKAATTLAEAVVARGHRGVTVSPLLCVGNPYRELVDKSQKVGAELIVLGRHGHRRFRDVFIGSTAERVIRYAQMPVLMVGRKANRPYWRPLIAVDLEPGSAQVVSSALRLLDTSCATASLLHAYHVPFERLLTPDISEDERTEYRKEILQEARSRMNALVQELGSCNVTLQRSLLRGEPRQTLLRESVLLRADLLAVGVHERSQLSHAVLGSVAAQVIHDAGCDVLMTPTRHNGEC